MQLSKFTAHGVATLHRNCRPLFVTFRDDSQRTNNLLVHASARPTTNEESRPQPSRRGLFTSEERDAADDTENAERSNRTSRRKLVDIHKESLKEAGVQVDPLDIQRNRLNSMRQAMQRGTRGPAKAAVTREFRAAERRLYATQRRAGGRAYGRDDDGDGDGWRWDDDGDDGGNDGLRGRGRDRRDGWREREGGWRERERDGDREQDFGVEGRGRSRGPDDGLSEREREREARKRAKIREKQLARERQREMREAAARREERLKMIPPEVREAQERQRIAASAANALAATQARRRRQEAAARAARGDSDDDEGEMEEGEVGEIFSLNDHIVSLGGSNKSKERGVPRPVTDLIPSGPKGPALNHSLPADLNLRLLEMVMAGKRANIPEIPVGASGLTRGLMAAIQLNWRNHEVVKLRIRDRRKTAKKYMPFMKQVCEALESMTGGWVIWRSGRSIWIYRGENFAPKRPEDLRADILGKREVPLEGWRLLTAADPLAGRAVEIPGAHGGYLTFGDAAAPTKSPAKSSASASTASAATAAAKSPAPAGAFLPVSGSPLAGPRGEKLAVLFLHDAYGLGERHQKLVADRLSASLGGVPVLMPDLFEGGKEAWRGPHWPPLKALFERQQGWMGKSGRGNYMAVAPFVDAAIEYLRSPAVGATRLALVGTGWGAWVAANALTADSLGAALAAAPQGSGDDGAAAAASSEQNGSDGSAAAAAAAVEQVPAATPAAAAGPAKLAWEAIGLKEHMALGTSAGGDPSRLNFCCCFIATARHFFEDEERLCRHIAVPMGFMCSKHDPMEKFQLHLTEPVVEQSAFKRFGKLNPGYFGTQAQWADATQAKQATQALILGSAFLRWHAAGDSAAEALVRLHCMLGRSGVGEKQIYNLNFPWLEQVKLFKGHEKQAKRAAEEAAAAAAEARAKAAAAGKPVEGAKAGAAAEAAPAKAAGAKRKAAAKGAK